MNERHVKYSSTKLNHPIPVAWQGRENLFDSLQDMRIRCFGVNKKNQLRADIIMDTKIKGGLNGRK